MAARKRSTKKRTASSSRPRPKKGAARGKAAGRAKSAARGKAAGPIKDRRKRQPETLRLRAFQPSLTVNNLEDSLRFYVDVLGFIVGERWEDRGVLKGVMLTAGVSQLGLSQDDFAKGRDRKKGEGVRIWCVTAQDVDRLAARIKGAGGRLA